MQVVYIKVNLYLTLAKNAIPYHACVSGHVWELLLIKATWYKSGIESLCVKGIIYP